MSSQSSPLDLLFLGSGNAFGAEGRAYSSFLLNGRYLFDCGPTLLPQLRKARLAANSIDVVLVSHFHADHFFGLPFLLLDAKYSGRTRDLYIVGPPRIEAETEQLIRIGFPSIAAEAPSAFRRRYVEIRDGSQAKIEGLSVTAAAVDHVQELEAFAYRVEIGGRSLVYSGDTTLCEGLLRIVPDADVIVLECSGDGVRVHLSPADIEEVARHVRPDAQIILTHLDGHDHPLIQRLVKERGIQLASDLARFRF